MKAHYTKRFYKSVADLPPAVADQARRAHKRFDADPFHPSLNFKQVHSRRAIYSIRISRDYRSIGIQEHYSITWFWAGSHADYDKLLKRL